MRGHGASDAPEGDYAMADLAHDLAAVIEAAQLEAFSFCGVSLGAMVGMAYAQRHDGGRAHRLERLVLSNTAVQFPANVWKTRIDLVDKHGMRGIVDTVLERFFTRRFLTGNSLEVEHARDVLLAIEPQGYMGCCAAIRDMQIAEGLHDINVPTLILTGAQDSSTPPVRGEEIAVAIRDSKLIALPGAHIPMIESPIQWSDALIDFLAAAGDMKDSEHYQTGLKRRREVLGHDYVEAKLSTRTEFTAPFQEWITQMAWGSVWTSSRLDDLTRRIVVLTTTAALGRWEEFELHVGAALRAGVEARLISEALFMVSVYAGVPSANTGFGIADKVIRNFGVQPSHEESSG
jgi:3-oxoadipate enol-lactonase/4-carboxymuconolactone decarboxylase